MSEIADANANGRVKAGLADNATHILVVDDDHRIRDLLVKYLSDNGFRVTGAVDATAARAAMRGMTFDLFILDVMMPGENGFVFAADLPQDQCDADPDAHRPHRTGSARQGF